MAWISVHQGIVGPKLRQLCGLLECSQWEAEGILVSLWLWGLDNADKYGLIPYADRSDIEVALAGSSKRTKLNIPQIVDALIESEWLDVGDDGIYIHDWEEWQEQWYKAKERREKDVDRKRELRIRKKEQAAATDGEVSVDIPQEVPTGNQQTFIEETAAPPAAPPDPPKPKRKATNYGPEFEAFWEVYPRQIGKGDAAKKYQARRNDGWTAEDLLAAAKNYALQCVRLHTAKEYIKHPKTFLSDSTPFVDFIPKKAERPTEATVPDNKNPFAEYAKEGT